MSNSIRSVFAKNLASARKRRGLTQDELAEALSVTVRYVQRLEGPKCQNVKIETLAKIAAALGITAADLLKK